MSARIVIDAFDFVRCTKSLHGKIVLEECMRLKEYLTNTKGWLEYKISGALDKDGKSILEIIIKGKINLLCQRCLSELAYVLDLKSTLLLAKNEKELSYLDEIESREGILATSDIDIIELIEDEVILSLPISPRHKENECSTNKLTKVQTIKKNRPFDALVRLKKLH